METNEQKELRFLLRLERSTPRDVSSNYNEYIRSNKYDYKKAKITEWRIRDNGDAGLLHRDFGPAIESADGYIQQWFRYGERHREDGFAYILGDIKKYWVRGTEMSEKEFLDYKKYGY